MESGSRGAEIHTGGPHLGFQASVGLLDTTGSDVNDLRTDPFYSPNAKPSPPHVPRRGEPLWSVRVNDVTWEAELRYHGEYGVEPQILRQGELAIGRRFDTRALAAQWADEERKTLV